RGPVERLAGLSDYVELGLGRERVQHRRLGDGIIGDVDGPIGKAIRQGQDGETQIGQADGGKKSDRNTGALANLHRAGAEADLHAWADDEGEGHGIALGWAAAVNCPDSNKIGRAALLAGRVPAENAAAA